MKVNIKHSPMMIFGSLLLILIITMGCGVEVSTPISIIPTIPVDRPSTGMAKIIAVTSAKQDLEFFMPVTDFLPDYN